MDLAVLRLSANLKRVGSSKGRSAGLLAVRMRPARAAVRSNVSARVGAVRHQAAISHQGVELVNNR